MSRRYIGVIEDETISPTTGTVTARRSLGNSEQVRAALIEDTTGDQVLVDDFQLPSALRADILRSDKMSNKRRKFRAEFPDGEIKDVQLPFPLQGQNTLVYRRHRDEGFREVYPGGKPGFGTSLRAEPEKLLLPVAGQAAGGVFGLILGSLASPFLEKGIERTRGFRESTIPGMATEGALDAAINLGADVATRGLIRIGRGGMGVGGGGSSFSSGAVETAPGVESVIAAGEMEGLEPVLVGQAARSQTSQGIFQQVVAITTEASEKIQAQQIKLFEQVAEKAEKHGIDGLSDQELGMLVTGQKNIINKGIQGLPQGSDTIGGDALLQAGQQFKSATSQFGGRLYRRAFRSAERENVAFDLNDTVRLANKMSAGVQAARKGGTPADPSLNIQEELSKDIADVVADLNAIEPILTTTKGVAGGASSARQLQSLRSRLFDIKQRAEGEVMGKLANDLWQSFTTAMSNPIGGSARFSNQWRRANAFWRFRETEMEKGAMGTLLKNNTPEVLFRKFAKGGNFSSLSRVKQLVEPEQWNAFRDSFVSELASDPKTYKTKLTALNRDPRSKSLLLHRTEEHALNKWSADVAKLEKSVLNKLSTENKANIDRAYEVAKGTRYDDLARQIEMAGGPNSDFAVTLRAGLYEHLLGKATVKNKAGTDMINPAELEVAIEEIMGFEATPLIMGDAGMSTLNNLNLYANTIKSDSNVGTSLISSTVQSGVASPTQPSRVIKSLRKILDKRLFGLVLAQPVSHRAILRANNLPVGEPRLRALGVAVAASINAYAQGTKDISGRAKQRMEDIKDLIPEEGMGGAL